MNGNGVNGGGAGNSGHRSHYGNSVPFRAGDWKCTNENCQYHNFAKNLCCLKCGRAKPASINSNHNHNNPNNHSNLNHSSNQHHGHHNNHNNHNNHNHGNNGGHNNGAAAAAAAAAAGSIHSVNTTAAAIAAATASGQPLNLSNSFMGLQQPQPHLSRQGLHGSQSSSSSPVHAGGLYSNISQLQQLQYPQKQGHSDHNTEQMGQGVAHLPQHLAFLQTQSVSPQMLSQHRQRSNLSGEAHNPYAHGSSMPMKGVRTDDSLLNGGGINLLGKQMGSMTLNDQ